MSHSPSLPLVDPAPTFVLNNGVCMPRLGLGVYGIRDADTEASVHAAIAAGYRAIDTAAVYGNERAVGRAIRRGGVPRSELFVTTKVWNEDVRRGQVQQAFARSLARLGLEHVDLYLVHWPIPSRIASTWKVMEDLYASGRARAIGVSNHMVRDLDALLASASVVPAVNQIEHHPYLQSRTLRAHCERHGIALQAWSPLMQGGAVLADPVVVATAHRHGRTPAQVVLRWQQQHGVAAIPKASTPHHLRENADIWDFRLSPDDMASIDALDRGQRCGPDPRCFSF